jgi:Ca2+:H+ antiporter
MSRRSKEANVPDDFTAEPKTEQSVPPHAPTRKRTGFLPSFNTEHPNQMTPGIAPEGESGRRGIHPIKFLKICAKSSSKVSMCVNVLWPVVPAAIAMVRKITASYYPQNP